MLSPRFINHSKFMYTERKMATMSSSGKKSILLTIVSFTLVSLLIPERSDYFWSGRFIAILVLGVFWSLVVSHSFKERGNIFKLSYIAFPMAIVLVGVAAKLIGRALS